MSDATPSEQLFARILEELRELRKSFDDRNKLFDTELANFQQFTNTQQPPVIDPAVIEDLQRRELQRRAQGVVEAWVKMIGAQYDKGSAYINVMIIGGYAAFFGLWTTSRSLIPATQARWAAIFMIISVSLFVVFSVWDMIRATLHMNRYQQILTNVQGATDPDVITHAFRTYEDEYNRHRNRLIPVWMVFNWLTVGTALTAVLLLLCSFISGLPRLTSSQTIDPTYAQLRSLPFCSRRNLKSVSRACPRETFTR